MGQPGYPQALPIVLVQSSSVAQCQRPHEARLLGGHGLCDPSRHARPPWLQPPASGAQGLLARHHIGIGMDACGQCMPGRIKATRIVPAVGTAQAQLQLPGLPGIKLQALGIDTAIERIGPDHSQPSSAHAHLPGRWPVHLQHKAAASGLLLDQADDLSAERQGLTIARGRPLPVQYVRCMQLRKGQPEQQQGRQAPLRSPAGHQQRTRQAQPEPTAHQQPGQQQAQPGTAGHCQHHQPIDWL